MLILEWGLVLLRRKETLLVGGRAGIGVIVSLEDWLLLVHTSRESEVLNGLPHHGR